VAVNYENGKYAQSVTKTVT